MKRTHLPLNALRVFDAAARHLSFTRAADELAVTPAAVGQQIRALEDLLGVVLFRRTPKGLELTDEASAGLESLRTGFLHFEDAVRAMQAGQSSHVYTIAAPRDFFAAWLAPRLADFRAANPEVRYSLVNDETADFTEANLDLAVRWTDGPGDLEGIALGPAERVTAGAGDWIAWPGDQNPGGADAGIPSLQAGDAGQALAAAAAGMGKARVPAMLAHSWAGAGRGVALSEVEPCRRAYWLVAPLPQWRQKKVKALVAFLTGA
jgi:LysR family glycine cleavage system transcriptional activator